MHVAWLQLVKPHRFMIPMRPSQDIRLYYDASVLLYRPSRLVYMSIDHLDLGIVTLWCVNWPFKANLFFSFHVFDHNCNSFHANHCHSCASCGRCLAMVMRPSLRQVKIICEMQNYANHQCGYVSAFGVQVLYVFWPFVFVLQHTYPAAVELLKNRLSSLQQSEVCWSKCPWCKIMGCTAVVMLNAEILIQCGSCMYDNNMHRSCLSR